MVAGLVFAGGRLLIARRRAGDHLGGLWEFPGGKLEAGETAAAALQRELREELEIDVEVCTRLAEVTHAYPEREVGIEFFACRLRGGTPQARGCAAFAWVTADQLSDFEFPPADAQLLNQLRASPQLWAPGGGPVPAGGPDGG